MKRSVTLGLLISFCFESAELLAQPITWNLMETPSGGRIFCLYSLPSGTLIAGAENSGIFRSTNNGQSWQETLKAVTLWSFACDSSANLFAGTYGPGVYRSTDDGITWEFLPGIDDIILSLTVSPDNSIYASTFYDGLFRSTNAGSSWNHMNLSFPNWPTPIWLVASDSSGIIYAGPANQGIHRSTDRGATWSYLPSTGQLTGRSFIALNPSEFFLGTDQGIYKSVDSGKTWIHLLSPNLGSPYIEDLVLSPIGIFCSVTDDGVFISADSTVSWVHSTTGLPPGRFLSAISNQKGDLFVGSDGQGVFRSTDAGITWSDASQGITGLTISSIAFSSSGRALAGTSRGIYASRDNGLSWFLSNSGITTSANQVFFLADGSALAGGSGIFRSIDGGITWNKSSNDNQSNFVTAFCSINPERVLAGFRSQILLSVDSGKTWGTTTSVGARVWSMTASPSGLVLAGTYGNGIYRSSDDGINWSPSSEGLGYKIIYSLLISTDGYIYAGGANGSISRSADNGASWLKVADIPPAVWSLVDDGVGNIYAGTNQGVFRSTDRGKNWSLVGQPTGWSAYSLAFDTNHFLFAGMDAGGIFRTSSPVDRPLPQNYSVSQNFPNPFNAGTTIEFTLTRSDRVEIVIYDLLGRQVATIANKDFSAGRHIVWWNANDLSSGVYFYQLRSSSFSEFRKMALIK